jgi:hypothetical protein
MGSMIANKQPDSGPKARKKQKKAREMRQKRGIFAGMTSVLNPFR